MFKTIIMEIIGTQCDTEGGGGAHYLSHVLKGVC